MGRKVWLVICINSFTSCGAFHRFFKSGNSAIEFIANKQEIIEKQSRFSEDSNSVNKSSSAVFNLIMDESGKNNLRLPVGLYYVNIKSSSKSHYDSVMLLGSTETTIRVGLGGEFIR